MVEPRYDTFKPRARAAVIDGLVFFPLTLLGAVIYAKVDVAAVLVPWFLFTQFAPIAYSIGMHAVFGQTLGKMSSKVKVIDVDERTPLTLAQAVRRDVVWFMLSLIAVFGEVSSVARGVNPSSSEDPSFSTILVGSGALIWVAAELATTLMSSKRRSLADLIAGSVVVKTDASPRRPEVKRYEPGSSGLPYA